MMAGKDIWSRLLVWRSWGRVSARTGAGQERDDRRRRRLERLAARGLPLWSEAPEHCDRCDRELIPGEQAVIMSSGEGLILTCPLCAAVLHDEGYRVVGGDANGPRGLPLGDSP
jgi:hypothetical protein